jgi:hypothetical protein
VLLFNSALLRKWLWCYTMERDFVEIGCEVKYDNMWRRGVLRQLVGLKGWGAKILGEGGGFL